MCCEDVKKEEDAIKEKIHYRDDEKTILYIQYPDGKIMFYQKDGRTISFIVYPDNKIEFYQDDGKPSMVSNIRMVEKYGIVKMERLCYIFSIQMEKSSGATQMGELYHLLNTLMVKQIFIKIMKKL